MRAPLSWLREYAEIPASASPASVLDAFVRVGLEDEAVHGTQLQGPIVVGEVLSAEPEPQSNGKTINWCQVRVAPEGQLAADGGADVRGIVCGAHNFGVGDSVVVTLPGAVLPGDFAIAARKTYGHVSDGMIASQSELGMGDDHDGIIVLSRLGVSAAPGTDAIELLGLTEQAVEVNVTPDRGYAMSIRGLVREYSNATGVAFTDPALRPQLEALLGEGIAADAQDVRVKVTIDDDASVRDQPMAPVFIGLVVEGIDATAATPTWMSQRLRLAGIRPLGIAIDITNYVMLELGQPIHGYDLDKLRGAIHVRRAREGEQLTTLDGRERTLSAEDILITDDRGPIGLAGVMGGAETELSGETKNVYIEAASFSPISIARTARRHKLPSEASRRFERRVDPRVAQPAAARVAELLIEHAGGRVVRAGSVHEQIPAPESLTLPVDAASKIMGVDYTLDETIGALRAVGCEVWEEADGLLGVTVPSWRGDLTEPVTLVEEIGRLCDFERIPSRLPVAPPGRGLTREQRLRRAAADVLAASGAVEVQSYPFVAETDTVTFGRADAGEVAAVKLANPLDPRAAWLRTSLLPGLLTIAHRNVSRGLTDLAIFETGTVFKPESGVVYGVDEVPAVAVRPTAERIAELEAGLPPQPRHAAGIVLGHREPKRPGHGPTAASWEDALELVAQLGLATGAEIQVRQGAHRAFHPGRCAELYLSHGAAEVVVGYAGEVHPDIAEAADLPRVVAAFEVDLDAVIELARREVLPAPISTFPAATQDLSLVVAEAVPAAEVSAAVTEGAGALLEQLTIVDDYRGTGLEDGQKSLTFALRFRATDRTLTASEASEAKEAGAALASERFGATMRA
ncbi:phenylalanine--tRNA ligase subunit beta [Pseudoclavibacter sp. RFBJ3]|uniref:phenylalanine--tRNA ligase subunit beta n=1 Tax=unclassified Pseudoclavibacter TaxID=2615177 RepID=UPI000CE8C224|nr:MULTISPECIES: phenylalanine--tRNA ligase subunit beta [unclassified Pseudoclavibacter]PPF85281.1 phenylalanine--tRNA ligase subunit beta [Pseudoclavibacter sp. RFBJ5]PPF93324.1 phenylalanine--tRNA ligase subunit beta [Pseudoclavibacter sp. RFBJ3]PPF98970.1 phenylalanine--tRNA ligase subunit beta [Pseudoclavibacter sp. RFBH5]PPG24897.1 phenylalanine--tRNA ligase subunit beta [Pseudoclavibacter sp. RFBI4]